MKSQTRLCDWNELNWMAENKEELKNLLMKVKEESEKAGLKLAIQNTKIMSSGPITSQQIAGETMETVTDFISMGSKITVLPHCLMTETAAVYPGQPWTPFLSLLHLSDLWTSFPLWKKFVFYGKIRKTLTQKTFPVLWPLLFTQHCALCINIFHQWNIPHWLKYLLNLKEQHSSSISKKSPKK